VPVFYRRTDRDDHENVVALYIFRLPAGIAAIVSWALPEPAMRVFSPSAIQPEGMAEALPYAVFLCEHNHCLRVVVELEEGLDWDPHWGDLLELVAH